jgi:hypothetical protein
MLLAWLSLGTMESYFYHHSILGLIEAAYGSPLFPIPLGPFWKNYIY